MGLCIEKGWKLESNHSTRPSCLPKDSLKRLVWITAKFLHPYIDKEIRFILALSVQSDWKRFQIDVKTAFLNEELDEEIYLSQPPGFVVDRKEEWV